MRNEVTVTQVLPVVQRLDDQPSAEEQAAATGLRHVADDEPGHTRVRRGTGFSYHRPDGSLIRGDDRDRIERLAIPPAWTDVWICPHPRGHLQATGRDAAGRKQYLYHPVWRQLREAAKFDRLGTFGEVLPVVRGRVDRDLRRRRLSRRKVVALVVALLDRSLVRVGSRRYARDNGAHGLTTLEVEHVEVSGSTIRLAFPGKGGQQRSVELHDRRLARQLPRLASTPGARLFRYRTGDGDWAAVDAETVNAYLRGASGREVTAKAFRTWGGTVTAARDLRSAGPADAPGEADDRVLAALDAVAERLGNTRAVARASYVHPWVAKAYRGGRLLEQWDGDEGEVDRLTPAERAVRRVLDLDLPPSREPDEVLPGP